MIESIIIFTAGFIFSSTIVLYHYKKSEVSYLLNCIKEDIVNLTVFLAKK
jgi:hypothetical protein